MASSGYLVSPSEEPGQEKLWTETWKRLDRFLPDLRKELDMGPKEKVAVPTTESEKQVVEPEKEAEAVSA